MGAEPATVSRPTLRPVHDPDIVLHEVEAAYAKVGQLLNCNQPSDPTLVSPWRSLSSFALDLLNTPACLVVPILDDSLAQKKLFTRLSAMSEVLTIIPLYLPQCSGRISDICHNLDMASSFFNTSDLSPEDDGEPYHSSYLSLHDFAQASQQDTLRPALNAKMLSHFYHWRNLSLVPNCYKQKHVSAASSRISLSSVGSAKRSRCGSRWRRVSSSSPLPISNAPSMCLSATDPLSLHTFCRLLSVSISAAASDGEILPSWITGAFQILLYGSAVAASAGLSAWLIQRALGH